MFLLNTDVIMHVFRAMESLKAPFLRVRTLLLTGVLGCLWSDTLVVFASAGLSASLNYSVEAEVRWLDGLGRPAQLSKSQEFTDPDEETSRALTDADYLAEPSRAPGLTLLRLRGVWRLLDKSTLRLSLRPDALLLRGNKSPEPVAFDSRAGQVYRPLPRPEFLESYEIESHQGPGVSWSLGVREFLSQPARSYPDMLGFGLFVHLPRNLFAFRLGWSQDHKSPDTPTPKSSGEYFLMVYQGPDDRADRVHRKSSTFDQGLAGNDPYYGGALGYVFRKPLGWQASFLLAYHETGKSGARERSLFVDSSLRLSGNTGPWMNHLAVNARLNRDSWHVEDTDYTPLSQMSVSITNKTKIPEKHSLLLGLSLGRSEFHPEVSTTQKLVYFGHQLEIGWQYELHQGFESFLLLSEEHREKINLDDETEPGFHNDQDQMKMLRRISLGINYLLQGS